MFPIRDFNRSGSKPIVTWTLIIVNILVFYYQVTSGHYRYIIANYGVIPIYILNGLRLHTLFTSMFLHADVFHLFGNMLYLYIFGDNVEDRFGHLKYLLLYFVFGLAGGLLHVFMSSLSGNSRDLLIPAIGASGAISGVLGAYMIFFPNARIVSIVFGLFLIRTVVVPAIYFIGFWFLLQLLYASYGALSGIAAWAHIGGFIMGVLAAAFWRSRRRRREYWLTITPT